LPIFSAGAGAADQPVQGSGGRREFYNDDDEVMAIVFSFMGVIANGRT
jgi:hypothetical protein